MLKKILVDFLFLFIVTAAAAGSAAAWDETGHKLTTFIAWERMTPAAREQATKILLAAPENSDLSVLYDTFNSRSEAAKKRELFMYASVWSDVVRNRNFPVRFEKYNQSDWHYAAIFWKQENGRAVILENFPEESGKAVPKLYDFEKILRDPTYKPEEKAIALAWFLHVGGDLHNPLHNASRVTETEPKGDQGGNMFVFIPRTENSYGLNLHGFWDSIIGRVKPREGDECDAEYLAPVARSIMKKHGFEKMRNRLKIGDYKAWNTEGFNFLNDFVYTSDLKRNEMPSAKYTKRTFKIAEEQIALAGYRLGETLNRIYGDGSVLPKN